MRNLVSVQTITAVTPIEGADRICSYDVGGWNVVDLVGKYKVGDKCFYFEIDSWIPNHLAPFLSKGKEPRVFEGVSGERLRTIKLRGALSQGLIIGIDDIPMLAGLDGIDPGGDLTTTLGVLKYERELAACLQGKARGNFPSFIQKTDQERVQNCWRQIPRDVEFEVTLKIDGSSKTAYTNEGAFGVCSRNLDLIETDGNAYWAMANKLGLRDKMLGLGRNIAIQGELWGSGINGNWEGITDHRFNLFDVWDIDRRRSLGVRDRIAIADELGVDHVPVITHRAFDFETLADALAWTEGPSIVNKIREGTVWKAMDGSYSFKIVSNKFLLKGGE